MNADRIVHFTMCTLFALGDIIFEMGVAIYTGRWSDYIWGVYP